MDRHRTSRLVLTLMFTATLAACGGESLGEGGSGGTMGLDAPDTPVASDATTLFRLGGFSAQGWEQFGRLGPAGFDAQGRLYLLDTQAMRVSVVDSTGAEVRSFGREGNGPGELASPLGMAVFPDGGVVITDLGNRGFVFFRPDGSFDRLLPFQETNFATTITPLPSGDVLQASGGVRISMRGPGSAAPPPPTTRPVLRYSLETGAPETVWEGWLMPPPDAPDGPALNLSGPAGQRISINAMPPLRAFEPGLHVAPLPDGRLVVADTVDYRIQVIRDGVVESTLRRPMAPVAVTSSVEGMERDRRLEALEGGTSQFRVVIGGGPGGAAPMDATAMERDRVEGMLFAPEIPVISRVAVDPEGRIWVERNGPRPGEPGPTDILTPEGEYLGTLPADGLRIPTAFGPDGLLAYLERDEMDAAVVEVRRLPPGWLARD